MAVPMINGNRYGWASISLGLNGIQYDEFTAITYRASQEIGKVRAKGHRKLGRTKGESDSDGSFTMLKKKADLLIQALGPGFMTGAFDFPITVSYSETTESAVVTDELVSCRIIAVENAPAQGTEPATTVFTIDIGGIIFNGVDAQE